jgi:hypothetical protein
MKTNLDWTNKHVQITDIRKLNKTYLITIHDDHLEEQIKQPLFVKRNIFEERLKSFFMIDVDNIPRGEILSLSWNLYTSKGYYVKIDDNGEIVKFDMDPNKWYISYIEIDGPLGSFYSIYRDKEKETDISILT